jgi:hypothetical protein
MVLRATLVAALLAPAAALAGDREVSLFSGDLAFTYGRNWSQGLNVAGLVGELKVNVLPQLAVGVRTGGSIGGGVGAGDGEGSARGYAGLPLMLKAEGTPFTSRTRPFVGLGVGVTRAAGGGAMAAVDGDSAESASWSVAGPMPTLMPEIGVDLGGFRISLVHSSLLGSSRAVEQSVEVGPSGASASSGDAPGLSGSALQVGVHFGGPRKG